MQLISKKTQNCGESFAIHLTWESHSGFLLESSVLYIHDRKIPWVLCFPSFAGCHMGCLICGLSGSDSPFKLGYNELGDMFCKSIEDINTSEYFQVSFMGEGEPLLNMNNIFHFCRHITSIYPSITIGISTVGIAEGIKELSRENWSANVKLQLSLHAWPSSKRQKIIPAELRYPFIKAVKEAEQFSKLVKRKSCINYVPLSGISDSIEDADELIKLVSPTLFYIKISEFNRNNNSRLLGSSEASIIAFIDRLEHAGIEVHRFKSLGTNIGVGCGQTGIWRRVSCGQLQDSHFPQDVNV